MHAHKLYRQPQHIVEYTHIYTTDKHATQTKRDDGDDNNDSDRNDYTWTMMITTRMILWWL